MRSAVPFFEQPSTNEFIEQIGTTSGNLVLYCGAGVTIDRTGHSWESLVRSGFPRRRRSRHADDPVQDEITQVGASVEQLASSLVHMLRERSGSKSYLQGALRRRFRAALYGKPSNWPRGQLARWIVALAVFRAQRGFPTQILTTNYDDWIEDEFEELSATLAEYSFPGLLVFREGVSEPLRTVAPRIVHSPVTVESISITYLHGRLPQHGRVSWPLILDENGYARSAETVEATIESALNRAEMTVLLGTSVRDTPLVRALSRTRESGRLRFAVLPRRQFMAQEDAIEELALRLAEYRARELRYRALFPDFHGQVAQLMVESARRTAFDASGSDAIRAQPYMDRLGAWWQWWSTSVGVSSDLTTRMSLALGDLAETAGVAVAGGPLDVSDERLQLELWVRADPRGPDRRLVRWARSCDAAPDGMSGKSGVLENLSYLAPVRTFAEGRPTAHDVADLEEGRADLRRYTWRSFLSVPVRAHSAIVGVVTLLSNRPLSEAATMASDAVTESLVAGLIKHGSALLEPPAEGA